MSRKALQQKLPRTMPTPAEARSALRLAHQSLHDQKELVDKTKIDIKAADSEYRACVAVVEACERDWLEAGEGTSEDLHSGALFVEAMTAADTAARASETLSRNLPYEVARMKQAEGRLRAAREDVRAIAEGRRR